MFLLLCWKPVAAVEVVCCLVRCKLVVWLDRSEEVFEGTVYIYVYRNKTM